MIAPFPFSGAGLQRTRNGSTALGFFFGWSSTLTGMAKAAKQEATRLFFLAAYNGK